MIPLNLQLLFPKLRLGWDESRERNSLDPWMMQIPCHFGTIFPHSDSMLSIEIEGHPGIRKRMAALNLQVWQDWQDGTTWIFPLEKMRGVSKIIRPYTKRSAAHLTGFRFSRP